MNLKRLSGLLSLIMGISLTSSGQSPFAGFEPLFTPPRHYAIQKASEPVVADGLFNDKDWQNAKWSEDFVDIEGEGKPSPQYRTRVKLLWDEKYLYVAAEMEEPHVWANPQPEKDIIFRDNVFKIFIDPDNNMNDDFEIQINPSNLMLFLIMNKPYRDGGTPVSGWTPLGLKSAVKINGTINKSDDKDLGWNAEIALPLAALNFNPADLRRNDGFRLNFLRTGFDFVVKDGIYSKATDAAGKALPPHYANWSPQGLINMHYPERWGYTTFVQQGAAPPANFAIPYREKQKDYLWLAYYKQKDWLKTKKRYSADLKELGLVTDSILINNKTNNLSMEASSRQFLVTITDQDGQSISIDQDGWVR